METEEKQVMKKLAECYTNDLIDVYNTHGEDDFRGVAECMNMKKEDIDSMVKLLKGRENESKKINN